MQNILGSQGYVQIRPLTSSERQDTVTNLLQGSRQALGSEGTGLTTSS